MATKAATKKVKLHTEKQYAELETRVANLHIDKAGLREALDVTLEVNRKQGQEIDELRTKLNKYKEQMEKEDNCDLTAQARIIDIISKRDIHVQPVLMQNALNGIRFRIEDSVRQAKNEAQQLQDRATNAWTKAHSIDDAVTAINALK